MYLVKDASKNFSWIAYYFLTAAIEQVKWNPIMTKYCVEILKVEQRNFLKWWKFLQKFSVRGLGCKVQIGMQKKCICVFDYKCDRIQECK